jgi:hypothetical protein
MALQLHLASMHSTVLLRVNSHPPAPFLFETILVDFCESILCEPDLPCF